MGVKQILISFLAFTIVFSGFSNLKSEAVIDKQCTGSFSDTQEQPYSTIFRKYTEVNNTTGYCLYHLNSVEITCKEPYFSYPQRQYLGESNPPGYDPNTFYDNYPQKGFVDISCFTFSAISDNTADPNNSDPLNTDPLNYQPSFVFVMNNDGTVNDKRKGAVLNVLKNDGGNFPESVISEKLKVNTVDQESLKIDKGLPTGKNSPADVGVKVVNNSTNILFDTPFAWLGAINNEKVTASFKYNVSISGVPSANEPATVKIDTKCYKNLGDDENGGRNYPIPVSTLAEAYLNNNVSGQTFGLGSWYAFPDSDKMSVNDNGKTKEYDIKKYRNQKFMIEGASRGDYLCRVLGADANGVKSSQTPANVQRRGAIKGEIMSKLDNSDKVFPVTFPYQGPGPCQTFGNVSCRGRVHQGTDLTAQFDADYYRTTPVLAFKAGQIRQLYFCNALEITHDDGSSTRYLHNGTLYKTSGRVEAGDEIASVGNNCTGASHLHFEYYPSGGYPINPYPIITSSDVKKVGNPYSAGGGL